MKEKIMAGLKSAWSWLKWVLAGIVGIIGAVLAFVFMFKKEDGEKLVNKARLKNVQKGNKRIIRDYDSYTKERNRRRKKLSE